MEKLSIFLDISTVLEFYNKKKHMTLRTLSSNCICIDCYGNDIN